MFGNLKVVEVLTFKAFLELVPFKAAFLATEALLVAKIVSIYSEIHRTVEKVNGEI